jgi:hypothetical protein
MTTEDYGLARRMWHQLEPVHAVFWYAPEVFAEAAGLGYEVATRWPSYFAWRLAPRGQPAAGRVGLLQLQPGHGGRARARRVGGGLAAADYLAVSQGPSKSRPAIARLKLAQCFRRRRGSSANRLVTRYWCRLASGPGCARRGRMGAICSAGT